MTAPPGVVTDSSSPALIVPPLAALSVPVEYAYLVVRPSGKPWWPASSPSVSCPIVL